MGDAEPAPPPALPSSSSSPNEAVPGPSQTVPQDDFKAHPELLKRVVANLGLEAEELAEPSDTLFDILAVVAPSRVALLVHEGVVKLVKTLWQTPSSLPSISKWAERKYYVPAQGFKSLYSHPAPNSRGLCGQLKRQAETTWPNSQEQRRKEAKLIRQKNLFVCQPPITHGKPSGFT